MVRPSRPYSALGYRLPLPLSGLLVLLLLLVGSVAVVVVGYSREDKTEDTGNSIRIDPAVGDDEPAVGAAAAPSLNSTSGDVIDAGNTTGDWSERWPYFNTGCAEW